MSRNMLGVRGEGKGKGARYRAQGAREKHDADCWVLDTGYWGKTLIVRGEE